MNAPTADPHAEPPVASNLADTRGLPLGDLRGACPDALGWLGITPKAEGERLKVSAFQACL